MDPEYIEIRELYNYIKLNLEFDLTPDQIAKIDQDFPEAEREAEKIKLKEKILKERIERAELLASILTLRYNLDYNILLSFIKKYDNLLNIEMMEKRINEIDLNNIDEPLALELKNYYFHYYYNYYKIVLEKIQDQILVNLIMDRILQLQNIVIIGVRLDETEYDIFISNIYNLVDKYSYNQELLNEYEIKLRQLFFEDNKYDIRLYSVVKVSLPEVKNIFRNRHIKHGFNRGNYIYIPIKNFRIPVRINTGQTFKFKGETIIAERDITIYPIKRLSKFTTIPRDITFSYSYNFLGFNMERQNILKRLTEINNSGQDFFKKLLFTIFIDYLLLFISDLSEQLKQRNIGLLITGGFAYRHYNYSYITEDVDIIIGYLVDGKISIKPIENYKEIFQFIIEYFNSIKEKDFTNEIIIKIIKKFFKDLKNMGINITQFDNIYQFYQQLERDNINIELFLSSPPHNDKILKLTVVLNSVRRFAYIDININDITKAINTFAMINRINPVSIQDGFIKAEFNIDQFYLTFREDINHTFYPTRTIVNIIYDTASFLNVIEINYIIFEKHYLIEKIINNLLFGILPIDTDTSPEIIESEKQRFLEKFHKLLLTHGEYENFMSSNPTSQDIQYFKNFIG
jgi:hypothetical protein